MKRLLHVKGGAQTVAYWLSIVAAVYACTRVWGNHASAYWLVVSFGMYLWCVLAITAGYHRLFAHRSYSCARVWHYLFGLTGTVFFQGSPLSWAAVHHSHHKYADTENDSHITDWRYWLGRKYGPIMRSKKGYVHLMRDKFHMMLHEYGLLFPVAFATFLALISLDALLFVYLLPLGVFFVFSNIHQSFSHFGGEPRNQPWLEFVFPACGEWTHAYHHVNPRAWRFGRVDLGAELIQRIRYEERG